MKKTCRFLTLTAVMAVTASLAVPAFAASEPGETEGTSSFFSTFVGANHAITNPVTEEVAPVPSTTDGTTATTPETSTTTPAVDTADVPFSLGGGWMNFPVQSDNDNKS
ncbi:hypothetical protein [Brevibacillus choshinensis]|uniref:hypothetical protein n=1 Tax=Brevibacillus choshinensis TaxID=54911 RepID=UPI002E1F552E|nr:hypothetical protein [Brevibacillus choshinensis]MED4753750.1 hypothetical protein [Brevibacillus choshinensis]MED4781818.1 hypothetical protein [Brevibacillus choshinensis]